MGVCARRLVDSFGRLQIDGPRNPPAAAETIARTVYHTRVGIHLHTASPGVSTGSAHSLLLLSTKT